MEVNPDVLAKAIAINLKRDECKRRSQENRLREGAELLSCYEANMCPICGGNIKTKDNPWRIKRTCEFCGWDNKYWSQG